MARRGLSNKDIGPDGHKGTSEEVTKEHLELRLKSTPTSYHSTHAAGLNINEWNERIESATVYRVLV